MTLLHIAMLFMLGQLPSRDTLPVVSMSPPHISISTSYGGYFVQLRNESGVVLLPATPPGRLVSGLPWFVDLQNLGPKDVTIEENQGHGISVHLLPKESVRIVSDQQKYSIER